MASSEKEFINNIHKVYSASIYKNLDLKNVDSFDKNTTTQKMKQDYEKLLPLYLKETNLFSKEYVKKLMKDEEKLYIKYILGWYRFVQVSQLYTEDLYKHKKIKESQKLIQKNIIDNNSLLKNSNNNMLVYKISIDFYQEIYNNKVLFLKDMSHCIKNFPPPKILIYFSALEKEKNNMINKLLNTINKENGSSRCLKKYTKAECKKKRQKLEKYIVNYANLYFEQMAVSIKSESDESFCEFKEYIKNERTKYSLSNIKKEPKSDKNIDDAGKSAVLLCVEAYLPTKGKSDYLKHFNLIEKYNSLINKKKI